MSPQPINPWKSPPPAAAKPAPSMAMVEEPEPPPAPKSEPVPILDHQWRDILLLLRRPQHEGEIETFALTRWQPFDPGAVRSWIANMAGVGMIELTDRGYVLRQAGRDEVARLQPEPEPEPIPGISEEAFAVLQRRLAR